MVQAYCVSCKAKETLKDVEHFTAKNGRAMVRGQCPHGHTACAIVKQDGKGLSHEEKQAALALKELQAGRPLTQGEKMTLGWQMRSDEEKAALSAKRSDLTTQQHRKRKEGSGIIGDVLKPLAKKAFEEAKKKALEEAKKKAIEIAEQLATTAVTKTGDAIKDKIKGKGRSATAGSKGKGIDSVPHKQVVKTMFYGPLGGEGLYLPGSPESRTGYNITAQRPVYKHQPQRVASPAPAPAQVAHQQDDALHSALHPVNISGKGKGRKAKGSGLF